MKVSIEVGVGLGGLNATHVVSILVHYIAIVCVSS